MDASGNILNNRVRFDRGARVNTHNQPARVGLNLNHIKFDLLKISELYDGVLTEDLGHLPLNLYNQYLTDLIRDHLIFKYSIEEPEIRVNADTGDRSFTYTINVQNSPERTSKAFKIHVGFYKSAWRSPKTVHTADGMCCMPNRLDREEVTRA